MSPNLRKCVTDSRKNWTGVGTWFCINQPRWSPLSTTQHLLRHLWHSPLLTRYSHWVQNTYGDVSANMSSQTTLSMAYHWWNDGIKSTQNWDITVRYQHLITLKRLVSMGLKKHQNATNNGKRTKEHWKYPPSYTRKKMKTIWKKWWEKYGGKGLVKESAMWHNLKNNGTNCFQSKKQAKNGYHLMKDIPCMG